EQVNEAVHVAPEFDHAMLRERPHDGRPEQPEFGLEESWRKELLDAPSIQHRLGSQHDPREGEAVPKIQTKPRATDDVKVGIDYVRPVVEGVLVIESEELIFDGNVWISCAGDRREQLESAAEFLVKDRAGQVVAALRTAIQEEPTAELL